MGEGQVHRFRVKDTLLAYDVGSGSLHLLDAAAWAALGELGEGSDSAVAEAGEELRQLSAAGILFAPVPEEFAQLPPGVKALCLNVAHDCNLHCRYCFAAGGSFGGHRELMPAAVGQAAVDFLLASCGAVRHLEIDFFGGEPLLNLPVVREVLAYARRRGEEAGKEFRFTLTTNGTLLDRDTADFLRREGVSLVLSLDGRPEVNDRMRGRGSYDRVVPRLQEAVRLGPDYHVRGTYTRHNLDFAADVRHLADLGFDRISVEPAVGDRATGLSLAEGDLASAEAEYERLAELWLERRAQGRPFSFFHFELDPGEGPCLAKRVRGCGAGQQYLAVAPDGALYPCHQFVGREAYRLGDVRRGIERPAVAASLSGAHALAKADCRGCWARFLCGGGCHATVVDAGELTRPDPVACALQRKRLECALYLKAHTFNQSETAS
ncbi:MAG: thioether cross-link-forming SCIFF peptide maturase [Thermaerobacter sp.]|nr:thioether cross-link-forming SCIFF peptide maturase [Thermaerobacter sp.]